MGWPSTVQLRPAFSITMVWALARLVPEPVIFWVKNSASSW